MSVTAATRGVAVQLLVEESDDETASPPLAIPNSFHQHKVSITGGAGVSAGAITVESAPSHDYAGAWSPITSAITVVADTTIEYNFQGVFQFIRTRISTAIANGTVSTEYVGS